MLRRRAASLEILCLNTAFYSLLLLYTLACVVLVGLPLVVLVRFVPRRSRMKCYRRAISWYGYGVIKVLPFPWVRVRYEDREKQRRSGPCIFVCNHRSASDPFLMACLPFECVQVVNTWPFRLPLFGLAARWAGYPSINEMPFADFLEGAAALVRDGVSVIGFPEGTRSGSRAMGSFHGAMFRLALDTRAPIVPVCISGNERIPPRGSIRLEPGVITIRKLPAMPWEDYRHLAPFDLKQRVRAMISAELRDIEDRT